MLLSFVIGCVLESRCSFPALFRSNEVCMACRGYRGTYELGAELQRLFDFYV